MIKKEEVEKIAKLSRIELNEKEALKVGMEISTILDYFDRLSEIDVSNINPFHFSFLNDNTMREDTYFVEKEDVKESFPQKKDNYLKVKEVF